MNRYPLWKYATIAVALLLALLYAMPNLFGFAQVVQVSAAKREVKVDAATLERVQEALKSAGAAPGLLALEGTAVQARFDSTEDQLHAKDALQHALNPNASDPDYIVAMNQVSRAPAWLNKINSRPMYLGLDLRGGVHFMLQVDMRAAITKRLDTMASDIRVKLREKDVRHNGVSRSGDAIEVRASDAATLEAARAVIRDTQADLQIEQPAGGDLRLVAALKPQALQQVQTDAVKQNINTLHKRVNELGVAEPVIQQQGVDRIVVQLPGVQDPTQAKELIGRTATLEVRLVDEAARQSGVMAGADVFPERGRDGSVTPIPVKRQVVLTGDRFNGADATKDENGRAAVSVNLDKAGGKVMRDVTRENLKKQMAIILFERGKGEAISVATIQGEFSDRFQITGSFTSAETNNLAILIRSGSLAAPMEIIEERTIGPSLGAANIEKGFYSVMWGFVVICLFMCVYYVMFGAFSSLALAFNLLLLVAVLSMLQATLTLPGMAAMALALGMAIDANVLINERIREELRGGASPQAAIHAGYDRAWATILDSNVTSLIAGLALLAFGSGPVRGFAVVHCIGILTSMFSAVFFSRGVVNLWYGRRKKLKTVSIGTVWRPEGGQQLPAADE